jgi:hypothetical protein
MWVDNDVPNWFSNIEKFLPVAIFKMATTIPHKFNIVRFQRHFICHFLYRVLAAILKMTDISKILKTQNCSSNGDLSLCQIVCLYHYPVRSYQH